MGQKGKVIVIGAGMAGLTAGHFLKQAGIEVVVVEKDSRPGGRIMSVQRGQDIVDVGAQFVHTNYDLTLELTKRFGLESDLVEMKNADMLVREGKEHIIQGGEKVPTDRLYFRDPNDPDEHYWTLHLGIIWGFWPTEAKYRCGLLFPPVRRRHADDRAGVFNHFAGLAHEDGRRIVG